MTPTDPGNTYVAPATGSGAWHHMVRTAFVRVPQELRQSAKARESIRRLRHRKVLR